MYARSLLIAILGIVLSSVQVRAQPTNGAPSVETRSDSLAPRAALLRSAILPGWGQLYNGKPYKALFFAGASATLFSMAVAEQIALDDARSPQEHEDRIARRNTRILFFALSATLASIDAYVDAHLAHFADRWDVHTGPDGSRFTLYIDLPSKED